MNAEQFWEWLDKFVERSSSSTFNKPLIMGVVNITSDSFSDGGDFLNPEAACKHALDLIQQGADLLDLGAESSRPGATPITSELELERLIPVIQHIREQSDIAISIDTYKPEVMAATIKAGANIINDIYALQYPGATEVVKELAVPVCLMHMQGEPHTMQVNPEYSKGVLNDIKAFFTERLNHCYAAGLNKKGIILDPGIGFGKSIAHNLSILQQLDQLTAFGLPLLLGVSRKSTVGAVLNKPVNERLIGGVALAVQAAIKGVGIIRTHDVDETNQAMLMLDEISKAG